MEGETNNPDFIQLKSQRRECQMEGNVVRKPWWILEED